MVLLRAHFEDSQWKGAEERVVLLERVVCLAVAVHVQSETAASARTDCSLVADSNVLARVALTRNPGTR